MSEHIIKLCDIIVIVCVSITYFKILFDFILEESWIVLQRLLNFVHVFIDLYKLGWVTSVIPTRHQTLKIHNSINI